MGDTVVPEGSRGFSTGSVPLPNSENRKTQCSIIWAACFSARSQKTSLVRLSAILVSFSVAVIKYPDKNNFRERDSFQSTVPVHGTSQRGVTVAGTSNSQFHHIRSQKWRKINASLLDIPLTFSLPTQFRTHPKGRCWPPWESLPAHINAIKTTALYSRARRQTRSIQSLIGSLFSGDSRLCQVGKMNHSTCY